ncbi:MAG: L-dopachrome tautomerase-related protein [Planctomycetota bacterium]
MARAALLRRSLATLACAAALAAFRGCGDPPPPPPKVGELVEVASSEGRLWTGVTVSDSGRVFVCCPRWVGNHTWSVIEIRSSGRQVPFPDADSNRWKPGVLMPTAADAWVCVQSVRCDGDDLYVLDAGNPSFSGIVGPAAKIAVIDLRSSRIKRKIPFHLPAVERNSYLNDLRLDHAHGVAYVTDSGLGAIVVVDLESGLQRRVLADHPSTKAEPDVVPTVQGRRLMSARGGGDQPLAVHADGLTLDPTGTWLYWQALTARTLWRAPTAVLSDPAATPERVAASVEKVGTTVVADGLETGPDGTIYLTAIEEDAIVARRPDGTMERLVKDPRLAWPDTLALSRDGTLWVTTSQLHRTPLIAGVNGLPRTPYQLFKTGTVATPR